MTVDVEIRDAPSATHRARSSQLQTSAAERTSQIFSLVFVGLGLLATIAWIVVLGWMLYRVVIALA